MMEGGKKKLKQNKTKYKEKNLYNQVLSPVCVDTHTKFIFSFGFQNEVREIQSIY